MHCQLPCSQQPINLHYQISSWLLEVNLLTMQLWGNLTHLFKYQCNVQIAQRGGLNDIVANSTPDSLHSCCLTTIIMLYTRWSC